MQIIQVIQIIQIIQMRRISALKDLDHEMWNIPCTYHGAYLVRKIVVCDACCTDNRDDESLAMAKERGGRLLKALTEEDSPAITKGIKLLRGAHQRVRA